MLERTQHYLNQEFVNEYFDRFNPQKKTRLGTLYPLYKHLIVLYAREFCDSDEQRRKLRSKIKRQLYKQGVNRNDIQTFPFVTSTIYRRWLRTVLK